MATLRETVVTPLGLVTYPNPYGQYPAGALSIAENIVMRAPGEIWAAPDFSAKQDVSLVSGDFLRKLFPLDSGHVITWVRSGLNFAVYDRSATLDTCTLPTGVGLQGLWTDAAIWPIRVRERLVVNTLTAGALVLDDMAPTTVAARTFRSAGMPQPHLSLISDSTVNAGTIPANVVVGYAAIIKRVFADGYEVFSVPSPIYRYANIFLAATVDPTLTIKWPVSTGVIAGDIVEVYRTDGVSQADSTTDPGDTLKLIQVHTIVSADLVGSQFSFTDTQACVAPFYQTSGRELYTNPGQQTALNSNRQPNTANALAKFKSYTFYGNVVERPKWTFQVPAGFGDTGAGGIPATAWWRKNGIGTRRGNGTITSGLATITGVSATEMLGITKGQIWAGGNPPFPTTARVFSAVGTTITMDTNATGSATTWTIADALQLDNATSIRVMSLGDMLINIAQSLSARYEITIDQTVPINGTTAYFTGATVSIEPTRPFQAPLGALQVDATNGQNYQEIVPDINLSAKVFSKTRSSNLLNWSKTAQPEHVPPGNETQVGQGEIISMAATKNALWIFCTDGLYRLSGDTPPWRLDWYDPNLIISAPEAFTVLKDTVYCYCNYGVTAITDESITPFTANTLADVFPGPAYVNAPFLIMERNELDDEIVISLNDSRLYVFNTRTSAWTYLRNSPNDNLTSITALAFQRTPATGAAVLLVGRSPGTVPNVASWNPPSTTFLAATARFQPWYSDEPIGMKQFIDCTHLFNAADAGKTITSGFSGAGTASGPLVAHFADSFVTLGVPRNAQIGQSIVIDFQVPADATQFKYRGTSIRLVSVTDQAWRK